MSRIALVLAFFACIALFSGCATPRPAPVWVEDEVEAGSDRVLWEVTIIALEKTGFPVGSGIEPGKLTAVSGWKNQLDPFRGKGFRERCEIHYTRLADTRRYKIGVRVERDRNMDIIRPLDLTYADWEAQTDNDERARVVLRYVKALLGTPPSKSGSKKSAS